MRWKTGLVVFVLLSLLSFSELVSVNKQIEGESGRSFEGSSFAATTFERGWIGVMLSNSLLYWHPGVRSSEVAPLPGQVVPPPLDGSKGERLFGWNWGYRFRVGIFLPVVGYDVFGNYTHFSSRTEKPFSKSVNVKHLINYTTLDIDCEHGTSFDQIWGTFWGIRNVWVDRTHTTDHAKPLKEESHFCGIGPRIGANLKWHLFYGINLFLEGVASLLYGKSEINYVIDRREFKGSSRLFSANLNPSIGVGWGVYETWYHFEFSARYEAEYYWNQNRVVEMGKKNSPHLLRKVSDQSFRGLTLKASVEF